MLCVGAWADDEPAYKVVEVDLTTPAKNIGSTSTITVDLNEDVYIMAKSAGSIHEHDWGLSIKGAESTTNVLRINASSGHKITKVVYTFASSANSPYNEANNFKADQSATIKMSEMGKVYTFLDKNGKSQVNLYFGDTGVNHVILEKVRVVYDGLEDENDFGCLSLNGQRLTMENFSKYIDEQAAEGDEINIKLLDDYSGSDNILLNKNCKYTLDLNGKTFEHTNYINGVKLTKGTLSISGKGTIMTTKWNVPGIEAYSGTTLTIEDINVETGGGSVTSSGTLTIKSGTFKSTNSTAVAFDGNECVIEGGSFTSDYAVLNCGDAKMTINGGTYAGASIFYYAVGEAVVNDGKFAAEKMVTVTSADNSSINDKDLTINGGVYSNNNAKGYVKEGYTLVANDDEETKEAYPYKVGEGSATAVESINAGDGVKALKVIENGKIVIVKDGEKFDITGRKL